MTRREQPGEIANTIANACAELGMGGRKMIAYPFGAYDRQNGRGQARTKWKRSSTHSRTFPLTAGKRIQTSRKSQEEILRWAFLPEEFVCMGNMVERANGEGNTTTMKTFSLEEGGQDLRLSRQFIVPNPFHEPHGANQDGKADPQER